VTYQHPLHYLLGLEGTALLRAYAGEHDREFAEERVASIRRLLTLEADGVSPATVGTVDGYRVWSATYDQPGNGLYGVEEPFVHEIVDALPPGVALDAACGTGRHSAYLAARGHTVVGVDSSAEMLEVARGKVPGASFTHGDVTALPLPDDHADLVVCALALAHLPDLRPAFAELARVLRPGGHLIVTDVHQETVALGSVPHVRLTDGRAGLIPSYRHRASDYLQAALPLGMRLRRCDEPRSPARRDPPPPPPVPQQVGAWDLWPWTLLSLAPAAAQAAWSDIPPVVLWHFQKSAPEQAVERDRHHGDENGPERDR
jgi:SAM-dependent methyltransferase